MTASPPPLPRPAAAFAALQRRVATAERRAFLALSWERIWPVLWPVLAVAAVFVGLAGLQLFDLLPGWLHAMLLLGFGAALAAALVLAVRRISLPDRTAARRRLETESGFSHRPLAALGDRPADRSDPLAAALWQQHLLRLQRQVNDISVGMPRPDTARRDPMALRVTAGLVLLLGVLAAGRDLPQRLVQALSPRLDAVQLAAAPTLDIWVDPPEYTRLAPMFLRRAGEDPAAPALTADNAAAPAAMPAPAAAPAEPAPISVPTGSRVLARVTGGSVAPQLETGAGVQAFEAAGAGAWQLEVPVTAGDRLRVVQDGTELGLWPMTLLPDRAPTIAFKEPPGHTERLALQMAFKADDDYGLAEAAAVLTLLGADGRPVPDAEPMRLPLSLPAAQPQTADSTAYKDLTGHEWAGLDVAVVLEAKDAAGQQGFSPAVTVTLPEREFHHPIAKAIVEQRRKMVRAPGEAADDVAPHLEAIRGRVNEYDNDPTVILGLSAAQKRIEIARDFAFVAPVAKLLWDLALHLEDGGLALAEQALRDKQEQLRQALDNEASDEEIDRLMQELQQAMDEYMQQLAQEMQRRMEMGEIPPMTLPPNADIMSMDELQQMMEEMRDMAQNGNRDAARDMLNDMQRMMEGMRSAAPMTSEEMQQAQREMEQQREAMDKMQDLIRRQQQLLDETHRRQQEQAGQQGEDGAEQESAENQPGNEPGQGEGEGDRPGQSGESEQRADGQGQGSGQGQGQASDADRQAAEAQDGLRGELGEAMGDITESLGELPEQLGEAEQAMRDARDALQRGDLDSATRAQQQALDALQQGQQKFVEQALAQAGRRFGFAMVPQQGNRGGQRAGRDPLGRREDGRGLNSRDSVQIPEQSDYQRSREILEELRRRAGDLGRSKLELDYIERLLRRF